MSDLPPTETPTTQAPPAEPAVASTPDQSISVDQPGQSDSFESLIKEIETNTKLEKKQLLEDMSNLIDAKFSKKEQATQEEIENLKKQLKEVEDKAAKEKEELIKKQKEDMLEKLSKFDSVMSERQSVVSQDANPYRNKQGTVEESEESRRDKFITALYRNGRVGGM